MSNVTNVTQLVQPDDLAQQIHRSKDSLLREWEKRVRQLPRIGQLKQPHLLDDIPRLLEQIARSIEHRGASVQSVHQSAESHGQERLKNNVDLGELIEEYALLRTCIIEYPGLAFTSETNAIVNKIIDEAMKVSVEAYIADRDERDAKRREDYLAFLIHDLRSPLTAIHLAASVIEAELAQNTGSPRARSMAPAIRRNIEAMHALVVKLLEQEKNAVLERGISVTREPFDLHPIVDSAIRGLAPLALHRDVKIINDVPEDLVIIADGQLIARVLQNLVANAIEYTPKGAIRIGAKTTERDGIECWVADDGEGIPDERKERLFEKYEKDPRSDQGLGLGLAVVKQLVDAHGGRVTIESELGRGTTARFWIPTVVVNRAS